MTSPWRPGRSSKIYDLASYSNLRSDLRSEVRRSFASSFCFSQGFRLVSFVPVAGAAPIRVLSPTQQVVYEIEAFLSLRSAVLWHQKKDPGKLIEGFARAMKADPSTAGELVKIILGQQADNASDKTPSDIEKG
jgi:hypothetical protein